MFIKDLIQKQINLVAHLVAIYSENPLLNVHFLLLVYIQETEFYKNLKN